MRGYLPTKQNPGVEVISSVAVPRAGRDTFPASVPSTVSRSRGQTFLLSSGCGEGSADGINCRCAREVRMLRRTALAC